MKEKEITPEKLESSPTNLDELDVDTSSLYEMDDLESQIVPTTFTDKDREIIKEYERSCT